MHRRNCPRINSSPTLLLPKRTNTEPDADQYENLYCGDDQWRPSPAFGLHPFPDKDPEPQTWLCEDTGPIASIAQLLCHAARFELSLPQAQSVLAEVLATVAQWKEVATSPAAGLQAHEVADFAQAFENPLAAL